MSLAQGRRFGFAIALLGLLPLVSVKSAGAAGAVGDLYVTSDASNIVRAYAGTTGVFLGNHSIGVLGSGEMAIHFGDLNGRYLVGSLGGGVDEYDAGSGAYIKTYSPGGGWQWAGIYGPTGGVYIGSMNTNDVREYDATTGAFIRVVCPVFGPADMRIGPNGNLYICSYLGGFVQENDAVTGAFINSYNQPAGARTNDIAFLPNGHPLVTVMSYNVVIHYDTGWNTLGTFAGTGFNRPHGIDLGPTDGRIYVVDGVTTQVHVFDPVTFVELNAAFLTPGPGDKIVDLEFRLDNHPTAVQPSTWSRVKTLIN